VNSGTLALTTSSLAHTASLGNTAIVTGSGTTFIAGFGGTNPGALVVAGATGSGTAGASLALGPGSNFIMSGSAPLTFRLQQENSFAGPAFTIGGASGSVPALTFGLGQTASDLLAVTGTVDVLGIGAAITVNPLSGDHFLTAGNYDLITGADVVGGNLFTLTDPAVVVQGTTYDLSLSESGTAEVLTVTSLGPPAEAAVNTPAHSFLSANAPQLTTAAVPEPGNLATLLGGLGVLATAFLRRRRKENRFPLI
jgi:hypothetical protein